MALWLFLNRTRVGMMIRAGVDDRGMLAASGVNVNLVFAITFAIGAGLAGLGGVIGAVELSMVPGEDTRLLLASLIVVIVGGMGSVVGAALGAIDPRPGRDLRPRLRADLQRGVHLRDPGAGARLPPARHPRAGRHERGELAQRDELRRGPRGDAKSGSEPDRPLVRGTPALPEIGSVPEFREPSIGARHVVVLAFLLAFPWFATPFFTYQIGAQSLALGLIALSLTFLGGYGGMVSLAQMTVAGIAGYMVAIFGTSAAARDQPELAVVAGGADRDRRRDRWSATFIGWLSVRTEGIYTIMITLAVGVAFYYLCLQNYSDLQRLPGLPAGVRADGRPASTCATRCRSTTWRCSGRSPATSSSSTCCARRSASRCRASATTRAA